MTVDPRLGPHQISPIGTAGAALEDGVYGLAVSDEKTIGLAEVDVGVTGLTSDDLSVTITDNGDGTLDLAVASGGGGGGGSTGKDRLWTPGAAETSIDEFNDDTVAAGWTRVDKAGTTGNVAWIEGADILSVTTGAGTDAVGDFHALMLPLTAAGGSLVAGNAFIIGLRVGNTGSNYTFGGLCIADGVTFGAGNQVVAVTHWGSTSQQDTLRSFANYSTSANTIVDTFSSVQLGGLRYARLVYLGSNVWRRDLSFDGVAWIKGVNTLTLSMTPAYVGLLASSWGTSTKGVVTYELLRRVSGIT